VPSLNRKVVWEESEDIDEKSDFAGYVRPINHPMAAAPVREGFARHACSTLISGIDEVVLPGEIDQLTAEDRGNLAKFLVLLAIFLIGCGCWMFVWCRELARSPVPLSRAVQSSVEVPSVEIAQRSVVSFDQQR
jgi:hypothetical protein